MSLNTFGIIFLFTVFVAFPVAMKLLRKLFKGFEFYFIAGITLVCMTYFIAYIDPLSH